MGIDVKEYLPFVSSGSARQVDALFVLDTSLSLSSLKGVLKDSSGNDITLRYNVVDLSMYGTAKRFPATITPVSVSNS